MSRNKLGTILLISDERASRERMSLLQSSLSSLRLIADLKILSPSTTEDELLKLLEDTTPQLILAPWYHYLQWSRIEGLYGLTRTSGPAFAGYFSEPLEMQKLELSKDYLRAILLDFGSTHPSQICLMIRTLLQENCRSGILPLLGKNTPVYCEHWYPGTRIGNRTDVILNLPEVTQSAWAKRGSIIRLCLNALWGLVYEEGPVKGEFHKLITANCARAYFQVAFDPNLLVFRLFYHLPGSTPRDLLRNYWPGTAALSSAKEILLRYADLLRIHWIAETNDIEIVVGLWDPSTTEKRDQPIPSLNSRMHSFWVSPVSALLMQETPFELPNPKAPRLKSFPGIKLPENQTPTWDAWDNLRMDAAAMGQEIEKLRKTLDQRESLIQEMRAGGVNNAPLLPFTEMELIVETFQERLSEARYKIRGFELEIDKFQKNPHLFRNEIETIQFKIDTLILQEKRWIEQISSILELYKGNQRA